MTRLSDPGAIDSEESYAACRGDLDLWGPWARRAFEVAGVPQPGVLHVPGVGTYPVVAGDNGFVVKFYGEYWCGPESHATEVAAYRLLAGRIALVPQVAGAGVLRDGRGRPWRFLVITQVAGRTWESAAERMDPDARTAAAHRIGCLVRDLAGVPVGSLSRSAFTRVLDDRRAVTVAEHRARGRLSPVLLDRLERDLPDPASLLREPPVFVHGDLSGSNIFVDGDGISGLIDFTDVYAGDLRYALVQLHLDAFRADRRLLAAALDGLGLRVDPREMVAFTFLHDFDVLARVPFDLSGVRDPDELGELLWV
ncbi:aminoglycoside phosphotransferase family protein [Actinosynnema sp. NPDC050436]|uniref:phosphotransferase family protein n=1 Tax=Actinosynnema sp. NPDC050436 TaxID=3155659 RepID=UPI0033C99422